MLTSIFTLFKRRFKRQPPGSKFNGLRARTPVLVILFVYSLFVTYIAKATPFTPDTKDIVASWQLVDFPDSDMTQKERLSWHFDRAQYPGLGNIHLSKAAQILESAPDAKTDPYYIYFLARLSQHQHGFDDAVVLLDSLLNKTPQHVNALLLKANILLIQSRHEEALSVCKEMFGVADIYVASACTLEVKSYEPEHIEKSYNRLSLLLKQFDLNQLKKHDPDVQNQLVWLVQIAADMALRLNLPIQANTWLSHFDILDMPVSYLILWADVQRRLNQPDRILATLGSVAQHTKYIDDALLVRLAMAESVLPNQGNYKWRDLARERVRLRVARQDEYHAADLARYYLHIEPNGKQALHWASINYKQAKMPDDLNILEQANALVANEQGAQQ